MELAIMIRRGQRSPVEVVEAALAGIEERNDRTNAFVTVCADRAREAAERAESALTAGEAVGPLHGVPVGIKDLDPVAGVRTTFGSQPYAEHVPDENEPIVDRLEAAGAIVVGKTNTPEYGHKGTTDNVPFGPTSTPFDPEYNAGGSSGGSAAAVADGLVPIAHGSDGGGSVRIPSAMCGVFGYKPSFRRVPRKSRPDAFGNTPFSHLGPHARTVEDAAVMLSVLAGLHPADPLLSCDDGVDYVGATRRSIRGLRVGYSPDLDVFPVSDRVRGVVDEAVRAFEAVGASVEETRVGIDHPHGVLCESWRVGFAVNYAFSASVAEERDGVDYLGEHRAVSSPEFVDLIEEGQAYSAVEYKRANIVRTELFEAVEGFFGEYDLLVTPTLSVSRVSNTPGENTVGPTEVDGEPVDPLVGWCLTYPFNMTGHPAASVPAGLTSDGFPVGLQVVGPRYGDETVLAACGAFERVMPWHDTYPG